MYVDFPGRTVGGTIGRYKRKDGRQAVLLSRSLSLSCDGGFDYLSFLSSLCRLLFVLKSLRVRRRCVKAASLPACLLPTLVS